MVFLMTSRKGLTTFPKGSIAGLSPSDSLGPLLLLLADTVFASNRSARLQVLDVFPACLTPVSLLCFRQNRFRVLLRSPPMSRTSIPFIEEIRREKIFPGFEACMVRVLGLRLKSLARHSNHVRALNSNLTQLPHIPVLSAYYQHRAMLRKME
ncbi:hypothetical protein CC2G_001335 [Coprinopsis cinerea AmutBmut pab1-1]|nr:hypothetical protein CC2G_001335 [Coprinopsis cinerea AmutBmut pab1-1]